MAGYIANNANEQALMLATLGKGNLDELYAHIPSSLLRKEKLQLPDGISEFEVLDQMRSLASKNHLYKTCFLGAGAYKHYIPSVLQLAGRSEFLTAYTPYQAEMSQGLLQGIFEYQTMMCELTGMEVSNASVYDGATAAAEAMLMCKERNKNQVLISACVHPQVIEVMETYCKAYNLALTYIPQSEGKTDLDAMKILIKEDSACIFFQQPNFYGVIEDSKELCDVAHALNTKVIMSVNPISCALLPTPHEVGADIAVGEGQPLGIPLAYGGPYLGFMCTHESMMRRLPGRIVGESTDLNGKRAFVLTLQAREQHIRREKASSSICSNQSLCALTAAMYCSAMGPKGLQEVANQCYDKTHYLAQELVKLAGFELQYNQPFFHEFVTKSTISSDVILKELGQHDILGGLALSDHEILWCVTEVNKKAEIDQLIAIIKEVSV